MTDIQGPDTTTPWICIACNAENEAEGTYCANCGRPRPWTPPPPELYQKMVTAVRPQPPPASAREWDCPQCDHHNRRENNFCPLCQAARPAAAR